MPPDLAENNGVSVNLPGVHIKLPPGSDSETVREAINEAKQEIKDPPAAPAVVPVGVVAVPEEPRLYDLVVPEHMRGAWTRHGAAELDVSGLRYALLQIDGDAQLVELDNPDHNQVWLLAAPAAPVAAEIAPVSPLVDKQDMGVPSAQGSGGTLWDTPLPTPPDATPLPTPRPTAPLTFDPAHAGPGGSSGGSTWGQP